MKTAIIGARSLVGRQLIALLPEKPLLFSSTDTPDFSEIDLAFFCCSDEQSMRLAPLAKAAHTVVIDSSSAFRMDEAVPLVIPEINREALFSHQGIIASPNCTTSIMLMPLSPLHKAFQVRRIFAVSYQAVSGAGYAAMEALKTTPAEDLTLSPLPEEEKKMERETKKILENDSVQVSATCIRVPILKAHSLALNVTFARPLTLDAVHEQLMQAPGIELVETATPQSATNEENVLVSRVRIDPTLKNTLSLWVCGDQLLKGAALNAYQIAKELNFARK